MFYKCFVGYTAMPPVMSEDIKEGEIVAITDHPLSFVKYSAMNSTKNYYITANSEPGCAFAQMRTRGVPAFHREFDIQWASLQTDALSSQQLAGLLCSMPTGPGLWCMDNRECPTGQSDFVMLAVA
jgi:hypothetical protein